MADPNDLLSSEGLDSGQPVAGLDLLPPPPGDFKQGFGAGVHGVKSSLYGAAALAARGIGAIAPAPVADVAARTEAAALEQARAQAELAGEGARRIEDVDWTSPGAVVDHFQYLLGQAAPSLALMFTGGVLGRGLGAVAGRAAPAIAPALKTAGMYGGAVAPDVALEAGSIYPEALKTGVENPALRAAGGGAAAASLDFIPLLAAGRYMKAAGRGGFGAMARKAAIGAPIGAVLEGSQELGQSVIERFAAGLDMTGPEAISDYINSFAGGAAPGTVFGAGVGAMRGRAAPVSPAPQPLPPPAPPAPAVSPEPAVSPPAETPLSPEDAESIRFANLVTAHDGAAEQASALEAQLAGVEQATAAATARLAELKAEEAKPLGERRPKSEIIVERRALQAQMKTARAGVEEVGGRLNAARKLMAELAPQIAEAEQREANRVALANTPTGLNPAIVPKTGTESPNLGIFGEQRDETQVERAVRGVHALFKEQGMVLPTEPGNVDIRQPKPAADIVQAPAEGAPRERVRGPSKAQMQAVEPHAMTAIPSIAKTLAEAKTSTPEGQAKVAAKLTAIMREVVQEAAAKGSVEEAQAHIQSTLPEALKGQGVSKDAEDIAKAVAGVVGQARTQYSKGAAKAPKVKIAVRLPGGEVVEASGAAVTHADVRLRLGRRAATDTSIEDGFTHRGRFLSRDEALSRFGFEDSADDAFDAQYESNAALTQDEFEALPPADQATVTDTYNAIMARKGRELTERLTQLIGEDPNLKVEVFTAQPGSPIGSYTRIDRYKSIISLALNAKQELSVADHEGFHYAEDQLLSVEERAVVRNALRPGKPLFEKLMESVRRYDIENKTALADEVAATPAEAHAYAFEFWRRGELRTEGTLNRIFEKIAEVLRAIQRFITGQGFTTIEDIFAALDRGEFAQRSRQAPMVYGDAFQGPDGVPVLSKGPDQTQTAAFKAWFGDSKVVDADGKPLVVYHRGGFNENEDAIPRVDKTGFHAGTEDAANARPAVKRADDFSAATDVYEQDGQWYWESGPDSDGPYESKSAARTAAERAALEVLENSYHTEDDSTLTAVYLSIKNPMRSPDLGDGWAAAIQKAKALGHDGIVYANQFEDKGSTSYIAFHPEQIKSAIGNRGTFDPKNPDIRFSTDGTATWYRSALTDAVAALPMKSGSAQAWREQIKGLVAKGAVKQAEIDAVGLEELFQHRETQAKALGVPYKFQKDEVVSFLRENGVQVEEVVLGTIPAGGATTIRSRYRDGQWEVVDAGQVIEGGLTHDEALNSVEERIAASVRMEAPKYEDYQLPGGTEYREVLLQLPGKKPFKLPPGWKVEPWTEPLPDGWRVGVNPAHTYENPMARRFIVTDDAGQVRGRGDTQATAVQRALGYEPDPSVAFQVLDEEGTQRGIGATPEAAIQDAGTAADETGRTLTMEERRARSEGLVKYTAPHFAEYGENLLAHVRLNLRTDAEGKKVLFLEEIQSDWAQAGKKQGFGARFEVKQGEDGLWGVYRRDGALKDGGYRSREDAENAAQDYRTTIGAGIPSAPFVTKTDAWVALVLKRMIRYAVENGADKIAWTTGEQQVSRYENALRKRVDAIEWTKTPEGVQLVGYKNTGRTGRRVTTPAITARFRAALERNDLLGFDSYQEARDALLSHPDWADRWELETGADRAAVEEYLTARKPAADRDKVVDTRYAENELSDAIGKAMADRIRQDPNQTGVIEGENIKIDDTGMAAFYERIVPKVANEVIRKLGGGKAGQITVPTDAPERLTYFKNRAGSPYGGEGTFNIHTERRGDFNGLTLDQVREQFGADVASGVFADVGRNPRNDRWYSKKAYHYAGYIDVPALTAQPGFQITSAMVEKTMQGLPLFSRGAVAAPLLNVGLAVNDGSTLKPAEVIAALTAMGVQVPRQVIRQSNTEPTLVLELSRPLAPAEAHALSVALRQEAIAQVAGGVGELHGPKADAWRPFNPEYFLTMKEGDPVPLSAPVDNTVNGLGVVLDRLTPEGRTLYSRGAVQAEDSLRRQMTAGEQQQAQLFQESSRMMEAAMERGPDNLGKLALGGLVTEFSGGLSRWWQKNIATPNFTSRFSNAYRNVFKTLNTYVRYRNELVERMLIQKIPLWYTASGTDQQAAFTALNKRNVEGYSRASPELTALLAGLTDKQRQMFQSATGMFEGFLRKELEADIPFYKRVYVTPGEYEKWLGQRTAEVENLIDKGYMPLRRYGDHTVHVYMNAVGEDGRPQKMSGALQFFSNARSAYAAAKIYQEEIARTGASLEVEVGTHYKAARDLTISAQQFLDTARRNGVPLTSAEQERLVKALTSADSLTRNRRLQREGMPGFSTDGLRVINEFGMRMAGKLAYARFAHAIESAAEGRSVESDVVRGEPTIKIDERRTDGEASESTAEYNARNLWKIEGPMSGFHRNLADELVDYVLVPDHTGEWSRKLRGAAMAYFIGGSLSAGIVNTMSVPMMVVPELSIHTNYTNAMSTALSAWKTTWQYQHILRDIERLKSNDPADAIPGIDPALRAALVEAAQYTMDTELHQIMGISQGQMFSQSQGVQRAMKAWMAPFRISEQTNRITSFIAAYKVASTGDGVRQPDGSYKRLSGVELFRFARDMIDATQNNYNETNRPGAARNPIYALMFMFKSFPLFITEAIALMYKANPKSAVYMLLGLTAMTGVQGLPFAETILDLIDTIAQRLFGSPFNARRAMRNTIKSASDALVGYDLSELVLRGAINATLGVSASSRIGAGDFVPGTRLGAADADQGRILEQVLGAPWAMVKDTAENVGKLAGGAVAGDWKKMADALRAGGPIAVRNAIKGLEQLSDGYASDSKGRRLVDVTGLDAILQMGGLSSAGLAKAYELENINRQTKAFYTQVSADMQDQLVRAMKAGDTEKVRDISNLREKWNEQYPEMPIMPNPAAVRRNLALSGLPMDRRSVLLWGRQIRGNNVFNEAAP